MTVNKIDSHFEVRDGLGTERLGDELLVLDKENQKIHRLNLAAAMVWEALVAGRDEAQIAADLTDNFNIPSEIARRDIDQLIESLVSLDLVVRGPTDGPAEE